MKSAESAACVYAHDRDCAESLRAIIESIGTFPCVVAASTQDIGRVKNDRGIAVTLLDRSLSDPELEELAVSCDDTRLATFGAAGNVSDALSKIESMADYKLRHPLARKDVVRLFEHVRSDSGSGTVPSRSRHLYRGLVGESDAIRRLRELIQRVAPTRSNVLITGETGTGKEIVARNIHYHSQHGSGPFVPVNCSAIPPDLLESELFGHKKGAFTGALSDRQGRFMAAAGGTLFLDEIGDMSPALQVKLLRVLEERMIYPVGCNEPSKMTARLVAATHRNLERSVEDGSFREDLFYRLNVFPIEVPPLRERKDDIAELAVELSYRLQREQGMSVRLTDAAVRQLRAHDWPGNVRELANLVERLAVIVPDGVADMADLPDGFRHGIRSDGETPRGTYVLNHDLTSRPLPEDGIDLRDYLRSTEAALIRQALDHSGGTVSRAASLLHVGRTTLTEKVKRLGLSEFVKTAG